jgi:1,4-alpha-glucan branching enzyme
MKHTKTTEEKIARTDEGFFLQQLANLIKSKEPIEAKDAPIISHFPMGANLVEEGGATFKVWAPTAEKVYLAYNTQHCDLSNWQPSDKHLLIRDHMGYWIGYFPDVVDGTCYLFYTVGPGGEGFKRDSRARELLIDGYPDYITQHPTNDVPYSPCRVRKDNYIWRAQDFMMPPFHQLIIYQLHIGVFYASKDGQDIRHNRVSKFLDVVDQLEYLNKLGINAIQFLPVVEWQGPFSKGYNNTDFFSPEMDYAVNPSEIQPYFDKVNIMLQSKGKEPLPENMLDTQANQFKVLVDLCHLNGMAVILDVVYNHGGGPFDPQSMRFFDQPEYREWWDADNYFISGDGWAGGRIFDYASDEVRQFLIDNAKMFLEEYNVDGFRYDEVSVISNHNGDGFCRDLTNTLRFVKPEAINIAEYWNWDRSKPVQHLNGLGFDATLNDGLRIAVRSALREASGGQSAKINLDQIKNNLGCPPFFPACWRAVISIEDHDIVYAKRDVRIPRLANSVNSRDWYARSRSRVATGIFLTAPGIPMLFMGQEILEDKNWHDNPDKPENFIYWEGLKDPDDGTMRDFLRFTSDVCKLRRQFPSLCGEGINPYYTHNDDRVIAYHRWVEGVGQDVIIVATLSETNHWNYQLPFPVGGYWREVFNSDAYDCMPPGGGFNPEAVGNPWGITAEGPAMYGCPASANILIPANSVLVFAKG